MRHDEEFNDGIPNEDEPAGPFGAPDGSDVDIRNIPREFVSLSSKAYPNLVMDESDLRARFIVGRKGSGKTLYLKRIRAHTAKREDVWSVALDSKPPVTPDILRFSNWFANDQLPTRWSLLWRRAVLRCLFTILTTDLKDQFTPSELAELNDDLPHRPLVRPSRSVLSVYSQVSELIRMQHTRNQMEGFLQEPFWTDLENLFGERLRQTPPICIFLDGLDNDFHSAPSLWLACQEGLFIAVNDLLQDQRFKNKVHIFVALRDVAMTNILNSEHATRYRGQTHIRMLKWGYNSIRDFFNEKIARLPAKYLCNPQLANAGPYSRFLGDENIENISRNRRLEELELYLMRHTRLLPRDIVILGNRLCNELFADNSHRLDVERREFLIRSAVRGCAKLFGSEQLAICANELCAELVPSSKASQRNSGLEEYSRDLKRTLIEYINGFQGDLISKSELASSFGRAKEKLGLDVEVLNILWRNGVIGYTDRQDAKIGSVFFSDDVFESFELPMHKTGYVFHSSMIEAANLRSVGDYPVLPLKYYYEQNTNR